MADENINFENLNEQEWVKLLIKNPECADKCDKFESFKSWHWCDLLEERPEFADKCAKWDKIDSQSWKRLLRFRPEFANKCNRWDKIKKYNSSAFLSFFLRNPQIFKLYPDLFDEPTLIKSFDSSDWSNLLALFPDLVNKCDKFKNFKPENWYHLLTNQSGFVDIAKSYTNGICGILALYPNMIDNTMRLDTLSVKQLFFLLSKQPNLYKQCDKLEKLKHSLYRSEFSDLLIKQPQLADWIDLSFLTAYDWRVMVLKQPRLFGKAIECGCKFDKKTYLEFHQEFSVERTYI